LAAARNQRLKCLAFRRIGARREAAVLKNDLLCSQARQRRLWIGGRHLNQLLAKRLRGQIDGGSGAGGGLRSAGYRGLRQDRIAEAELDARGRNTERV